MNLSLLEYALLGLVRLTPSSGYDLRRLFQTTPIGMFSDSPGAIYPALKRLEARGLIRGEDAQGPRKRKVFTVAESGREVLWAWLSSPIPPEGPARRADALDLRFAFISQIGSAADTARYLRAYSQAMEAELGALNAFLAGPGGQMPRMPQRAVQLGMSLVQRRLDWSREVMDELGEDQG